MEHKTWEIIVKHLSGQANPEEITQLEELLINNHDLKKEYDDLKENWEQSAELLRFQSVDTNKGWNELKQKIIAVDKIKTREAKTPALAIFARAAALILLLAALGITGYLIYSGHDNSSGFITVKNTNMEVKEIILPDDSRVLLNAGSELKYLTEFNDDVRNVYLNGEAFFDVTKDTLSSFTVNSAISRVTVLGTSFNFESRDDDTVSYLVVQSGEVIFSCNTGRGEITCTAGTGALIYKNASKPNFIQNADFNTLAWHTGYLKFNHTPLNEVVQYINKAYRVSIILEGEGLQNCKFTGTFDNISLDSVIEILTTAFRLEKQYVEGNIVLIGKGC
ncbi:MAG: FecR family protein [bacterium]